MIQHPSLDELTALKEANLPLVESKRIRSHVEDCPECQLMAREMGAFNKIWDEWSIESHVAAYQQARLSGALEELRSQVPGPVRERLGRWLERCAGKAAGAVRVILETSKEASRFVSEGLDPLTLPQGALQFAAVRTRGAVAVRTRGTAVRVRGDGTRLRGGVRTRGGSAPVGGAPMVQVEVSRQREVTIEADDLLRERASLVVLVSLEEGIPPRVAALERQGGVTGPLVARFTDLPLGDYVVAFEPTEAG